MTAAEKSRKGRYTSTAIKRKYCTLNKTLVYMCVYRSLYTHIHTHIYINTKYMCTNFYKNNILVKCINDDLTISMIFAYIVKGEHMVLTKLEKSFNYPSLFIIKL